MTENAAKYDEIRTGDALGVDTDGVLGSSIDWFQEHENNHAAICIWVHGELWVFEAVDSGNAFTKFEEYLERQAKDECRLILARNRKLEKINADALLLECMALTDGFYGYHRLFGVQIVRWMWKKAARKLNQALRWAGIKWRVRQEIFRERTPDKPVKHWICGQLVMYLWFMFSGKYANTWRYGAPSDIWKDFSNELYSVQNDGTLTYYNGTN